MMVHNQATTNVVLVNQPQPVITAPIVYTRVSMSLRCWYFTTVFFCSLDSHQHLLSVSIVTPGKSVMFLRNHHLWHGYLLLSFVHWAYGRSVSFHFASVVSMMSFTPAPTVILKLECSDVVELIM